MAINREDKRRRGKEEEWQGERKSKMEQGKGEEEKEKKEDEERKEETRKGRRGTRKGGGLRFNKLLVRRAHSRRAPCQERARSLMPLCRR